MFCTSPQNSSIIAKWKFLGILSMSLNLHLLQSGSVEIQMPKVGGVFKRSFQQKGYIRIQKHNSALLCLWVCARKLMLPNLWIGREQSALPRIQWIQKISSTLPSVFQGKDTLFLTGWTPQAKHSLGESQSLKSFSISVFACSSPIHLHSASLFMLKDSEEENTSGLGQSAGSTTLVRKCFCPHYFPSHCFVIWPFDIYIWWESEKRWWRI